MDDDGSESVRVGCESVISDQRDAESDVALAAPVDYWSLIDDCHAVIA